MASGERSRRPILDPVAFGQVSVGKNAADRARQHRRREVGDGNEKNLHGDGSGEEALSTGTDMPRQSTADEGPQTEGTQSGQMGRGGETGGTGQREPEEDDVPGHVGDKRGPRTR